MRSLTLGALSLATAAACSLAVVPPTMADPLPAPYQASAHGDLLSLPGINVLPAILPGGGNVAGATLGHAQASADSTLPSANTKAESANLDASVLFGGIPLPVDVVSATAPPGNGPTSRTLLALPLAPLLDLGVIGGTVQADYTGADSCVPAASGRRILSKSRTTLAATTVVPSVLPGLPYIAQVGASNVETETALVDDGNGGSDVEAVTTTKVADVGLLGGAVTVNVTSPVVLRAHSDGTTGTAGLVDTPVIKVNIGDTVIPIPLNGSPISIPVVLPANPLLSLDLKVTAFNPSQQSAGATGEADMQALLKVDLTVGLAGATLADVHLSLAPMHVKAVAPTGGVECSANEDPDNDGLTNAQEAELGTNPNNPDTDADGLQDGAEVNTHHTNPLKPDTDGDGLTDGAEINTYLTDPLKIDTDNGGVGDGAEVFRGTNPLNAADDIPPPSDTDGDGLPDVQEVELGTDPNKADTDGDGLTDGQEVNTHHTDPLKPDTDNGGVSDGAEVAVGTNPLNGADDMPPPTDKDGDGLSDAQEQQLGTDPNKADTDGDGLTDGQEVNTYLTDPLKFDTDNGGVGDGAEVNNGTNPVNNPTDDVAPPLDTDGDGLPDVQEADLGTDPNKADTDGDGLTDGQEVNTYKTDPKDADTDNDGLTDGQEVNTYETDPKDADTDNDALNDGVEVKVVRSNPKKPDTDGDGLKDGVEVKKYKTSPLRKDTDKDGLSDRKEVTKPTAKYKKCRTNPLKKDTDKDGLKDRVEISRWKTNPCDRDTDDGGKNDGAEVKEGANPLIPNR